MREEQECTCYHNDSPYQNVQDYNGCPIHCQHYGINTSGEWHCSCGASSDNYSQDGQDEHDDSDFYGYDLLDEIDVWEVE